MAYTVTYTDGVEDEEVFADEVHENLSSGVATPAFSGGTPTRTGYVFKGWNPEVAATVTGNATYVATWGEDKNNNGIDDNEETKYTVTYTDGVDGEEVFADQVYGNLLSGVATPAFEGTPTREGYVFKGWNPAVAATVKRPGGRHPGRGAGLDPGSYPRPDPALRLYGISHGAGAGLVYPDRAGEYRGKCRAAGSPFACMAVQGYCSAGVRRGQYRR